MRKLLRYWEEDRLFFIGWFFLQWILGCGERLKLGPFGMHQGAQADRAGVAWNFYHETLNLFLPRVMENRAAEGIAGMEFPIISYVVGLGWRVFGFHDWMYRLVVGLIVTAGYWSIWRLLKEIGIIGLGRVAIVLLLFLSPIMVFYTWNFLPDPAALGFVFIGLYHWHRWRINANGEVNSSPFWVWFFFSLAGLIKVSMLIPFLSLISLEYIKSDVLSVIRGFGVKQKLKVKNTEFGETIVLDDVESPMGNGQRFGFLLISTWRLAIVYLGVILTVVAWYVYSAWLTKSTWNIHFIQTINPVGSLHELVDILNFVESVWLDSLFFGSALFWLLFLWVFSLLRKQGNWEIWDILSVINFLGFLCFFLLFSRQFRFHDYYLLTGWPFVFLALVVIFRTQLWQRAVFVGFTGIVSIFFFVYYPIRGIGHSSKMLSYRTERGNYYCQNVIKDEQGLVDIGSWLNQRGDPNYTAEVLVVGDPSPSTALYYLHRKGLRLAPDFDSVACRGIWNKRIMLESGISVDSLRWQWEWDYRYGKRRKLDFLVVEKGYSDTLGISSYIVDIKNDKNLVYSSGNWKLYQISK